MFRMSKRAIAVLMSAAVLVLTICGSMSVSAEGKDPYTDEIKVGYISSTLTSVQCVTWGEAIETALSGYPNITVEVFDGGNSAEKQNEILSELVVQNYDACVIQAIDSSASSASIERAEEAGVNVVTINIGVDAIHSGHVVGPSDVIGRMTADAVAEACNEEGQVAYIDVPTAAAATVFMGSAFKEEIESNFPNMEVVGGVPGDFTAETANQIARDYLTQYPDLKAIYAGGDSPAIGVMQAVEAAGKAGEIQIWGLDGIPEVLDYIDQGKITGTFYNDNWEVGKLAGRLALYCVVAGVDGTALDKTPDIPIIGHIVTKDNVGEVIDK